MEAPPSTTANVTNEPVQPKTRVLPQSLEEQRRRIEQFLASQRQRLQNAEADLNGRLGRVADELRRSRAEMDGLRVELESRAARLDEEARHVAQLRADLDAARADWEAVRRLVEKQQGLLQEQTERQQQEYERQRQEFSKRQAALEEAHAKLEDARSRLEDDRRPAAGDDEYHQRYEIAVSDIRELRSENDALKDVLNTLKSQPKSEPSSASGANAYLNWEDQKRKLLDSLGSAFNEDDEEDAKERAKIQDVIKKTERVLAQKETEINELKQLLENQSENIGSVAVGAAAIGDILNRDEIICEERKNLKQLQEELREKLRAAEIDISVERARIARDRVELEEKMRLLAQQKSGANADEKSAADARQKPVRGRWLSRLGLSDLEKGSET